MQIWEAILLGLVQGLTEFLPISSSGHLVLFQGMFGITEASQTFDIFLHLATLVAVFAYYWEDIYALIRRPFQKTTYLLILGTIPTVILALLLNDTFNGIFGKGSFIGFNFIITGLILLYANGKSAGRKKLAQLTYKNALAVGIMQGIAIMPAISRSGMTISASLFQGMDRENAARFSFLLSIPAILGAVVLALKDVVTGEAPLLDTVGVVPMLMGCLTAALSGYFAIRFMVNILKKGQLKWFAYYVFLLGGVLIVDQFWLHMIFA